MKNKLTDHNPMVVIGSWILSIYIIVGFLTRIILIAMEIHSGNPISITGILQGLILGAATDLAMAMILMLPLAIVYLGLNDWKYQRIGWLCAGLWWIAFIYVLCFHTPLNEYGGGAPTIARIFLGWKAVSFTLRMTLPKLRNLWRRISLYCIWSIYTAFILFIAVGECFFWEEFGVRYNFIAVDYLVYTHEVVGNIMESYAMGPIIAGIVFLTAIIVWFQSRRYCFKVVNIFGDCLHWVLQLCTMVAMACGGGAIVSVIHNIHTNDLRVEQLQQNGAYDFCYAFTNSALAYDQFYVMIPDEECQSQYAKLCNVTAPTDTVYTTTNKPNIVLITVESLSAEFMQRFGDERGLTPTLDSLARSGLSFDALYATGNRTVRGLEALSLGLPPSAGESIIKRPANRMGHASIGALLRSLGYKVQFFYGGDSYFDNMRDFFSHNGYEVIDRHNIAADSISFANIWGVADEDIYGKLLRVLDDNATSSNPFFAQVMTTSNHRPYTYTANRVPGSPKTREGAVQYTDCAINFLMRQASTRPWFDSTIFIIIADHCASSAGQTTIPIDNYHIPCIVYAPSLIAPEVCSSICSQIDVLPTLFARFGLPTPYGAGLNVTNPDYLPRAFMATYQNLGYFSDNILTVLSPVKRVEQFTVIETENNRHIQLPLESIDSIQLHKAIAVYQYVDTKIKPQK